MSILLFSIFTFFLTILGVLEFWRLEGERERAFKDEALLKSHLNLSKNLALEIGDEEIISLLDSLERGVKSKTFKDKDLMGFAGKIKKRTEGIITGGRKATYWIYFLFVGVLSILASTISVLGFIEIRRNLNVLKNLLLDLRLGILWERLELGGALRNVQKVVRS